MQNRRGLKGNMCIKIVVTILITVNGQLSLGRLLTKPANTACYDGEENINMVCSSSLGSAAIQWNFTPFEETNSSAVAVGSTVNENYTQLFYIQNPNPLSSHLVILRASKATAGTYACWDNETTASAQFLTITSNGSYTNLSDVANGDTYYHSCYIGYYGNNYITPVFNIIVSADADYQIQTPALSKQGDITYAIGTVIDTAVCGTMFQDSLFDTYFSRPKGNLPPDSAMNIPTLIITFRYLNPMKALCVPSAKNMTISGANSGDYLFPGMELTCNVTSDPPANYVWTDLANGNSSNGSSISVWHSGSYQCTASTYINGTLYSASKTVNGLNIAPLLSTADPSYGPIAGGTRVTMTVHGWSRLTMDISAVYLGTNLNATIITSDRSRELLIILTPETSNASVGQSMPITTEFLPGPLNVTVDHSFLYRSNPQIDNINPRSFIVTGGSTLTVTGNNLSSVSVPYVSATVVINTVKDNSSVTTTVEPCKIQNKEGNQMFCRMPHIDLPKDFLTVLDSQFNYTANKKKRNIQHQEKWFNPETPSSLSRHKRYSSALVVTGTNGIDRAVIYLGFLLDGYKKYLNINDALPDIQVVFFSPPEINSSTALFEFDPSTKELFVVKGKYMTRGCRMDDYVVYVGNKICVNVDLQSDQLRCRLPDAEPKLTANDSAICAQHISVNVYIGYKQYQYTCLNYVYKRDTALIIGLCVGLGGLVFLIFAIAGIIRFCGDHINRVTKTRKSKRHSLKKQEVHQRYDNMAYFAQDSHV